MCEYYVVIPRDEFVDAVMWGMFNEYDGGAQAILNGVPTGEWLDLAHITRINCDNIAWFSK